MIHWLTRLRDKIFGVEKLEYRIVKSTREYSDFKFKELKAMEILKPYFPSSFVFETGYTLSFQEIQHIANDIVIHRPATILEVGSGLSTIILSNLISELGYNPEFISIDQDSSWQKHLEEQCENVDFYNFEIGSNSEFAKDGGKWFELPKSSLLREKKYDLVIIDGPKGYESQFARFGIVYFLKERVNETSIVFLDDTDREDENYILEQMKELLPLKSSQFFNKYSRLSNKQAIVTSPS
ncbi:class I SAM-dependent methyltransferase [Algoriphagus halophytocola]|uniref:class I SAM-dependent methyltransferase n=1 Tax=Algoriphagus halophytocola TaxID=2991499 RepID=UPI0022DE3B12|nr:class I SAM-dependent methyltransferase [Algoriphagus sp. TR-M9]WBL41312.1 class I SAM-dependent methyltransferase [Algoriphagus sp. TR-M9]